MSLVVVEGSCRICFIETNNLLHLLDIVDGMQSRIVELLENCGGIEVDLNDYFSKNLCENCTSELLICAKFREKCKKSQEILSRVEEVEEFQREEESQEPLEEVEKGLDVLISDEDTKQVAIYKIEIDEDQESDLLEGDVELKKVSGENEVSEIDYIFDENSREDVENLEADFADTIVKDVMKNKPSLPELKPKANQELYNAIVRSTEQKKVGSSSKPTVINFSCDACGAGFYQIKNLRKHLRSHNPDKIYTCSNCDCVFTQIDNLDIHMAKEHPNQSEDDETTANTIDCQATNSQESPPSNAKKKSSTENVNLNPKDAEVEINKKPNRHVCSQCQKGFASQSALNSHIRIHTGDRPFQCKDCDKTFTTQGALVLHTRRHSGLRPFPCSVCGKGFTESSNLKVHMRTHTGEKPHQCTICDRKFARVFLLQIHLRTHTGEKPYKCSNCDKAFAQLGDLSAHKKIHTGERPHRCPYCKKGFIKSSALSQHLRKHTKKGDIEANDAMSIQSFEILELEDDENVQ